MTLQTVPPRHLWLAVAAALLMRVFDTMPRGVVKATATAAPWAVLLVGLVALVLFLPAVTLLTRLPGKNLTDLCLVAGGRPLAVGAALLAVGLVVAAAGVNLRLVAEMAVTAIYPHTPQTFLISSMLLVAALGAALSPSSLLWIGALFFWPLILGVGVILAGNVGWGEFSELLPVAGPGIVPVATSLVPMTSYLGELGLLALFSREIRSTQGMVRAVIWITTVVAVVWGALILVYVIVFPYPGGTAIPFPVYEMTRLVQGGRFLERLDGMWVMLWTFGSVFRLALTFMGVALFYQDAFHLPTHRMVVLPMAIATLAVSLFPSNQRDAVFSDTCLVNRWGFLISLMVPAAISLLVRARRGGHA